MVLNLSRIFWRNIISFTCVPFRGLCRFVHSGDPPLAWLIPVSGLLDSSLRSPTMLGVRGYILFRMWAVLSSMGSFAATARSCAGLTHVP